MKRKQKFIVLIARTRGELAWPGLMLRRARENADGIKGVRRIIRRMKIYEDIKSMRSN